LGINGYALKDNILRFLAQASPDLEVPSGHADHRSQKMTRAEAVAIGNLEMMEMVVVPNLDTQFGVYEE